MTRTSGKPRTQSTARRKRSAASPRGRRPRSKARPGAVVVLAGGSSAGRKKAAAGLADQLGRTLFRVDLSMVVSQYIGETEKNLDRLLAKVERTGTILLVDEADALFGTRTSGGSSRNRDGSAGMSSVVRRIEEHAGLIIVACRKPRRIDPPFAPNKPVVLLEAQRPRKKR